MIGPLADQRAATPDFSNTVARVRVQNNGTLVGSEQILNFIAGTNVAYTITDDQVNGRITLTITVASAAPSGAAGGVLSGTYPNPAFGASVDGAGLTNTAGVLSVNPGNGTVITADAVDVDLGMVCYAPPDSQTIPANYAAYVPYPSYQVASGQTLTLGTGAVMEIARPSGRLFQNPVAPTPSDLRAGDQWWDTVNYALKEYTTATTGWVAPWNLPWGYLAGLPGATANQTGISTQADVTNVTATITTVANRRIKLTCAIQGQSVTTGGYFNAYIMEGATQLQNVSGFNAVGETETLPLSVVISPTVGSHTYKVQVAASAGTETIISSATAPTFLLAEDIGPNGTPA